MILRLAAPRRDALDDQARLPTGQSALFAPYENQARALRRAAQAARENRPAQDAPRFLNAKQWENHPQANGQPRPRPDDVVTERQRRQLGLPTLRMNAELRKQKNTIASAYRKHAQETMRGLARMQQSGFTVTSRLMRGDPAGVEPGAKKMDAGLKWYEKGVISTTVNQVVAEKYASTYQDDDTYKIGG
jgi:hypothetical protein